MTFDIPPHAHVQRLGVRKTINVRFTVPYCHIRLNVSTVDSATASVALTCVRFHVPDLADWHLKGHEGEANKKQPLF